ncbi:MAG: restriction endonuclease subunit S [Isosphaeraceae bacterium]
MNNGLFFDKFDTLTDAPNGVVGLRELILQLSVRGKLVPQVSTDGTAAELLTRIEDGKRTQIGKLLSCSEQALPPIAPSEVCYDVPASWKVVRLGEIAEYNQTEKVSSDEIPGDAWLLDLEDIEKDTSRLLRRVKFIDRASRSSKAAFAAGDVLYGKLRPYLNKVLVADAHGYCTTEVVPIRPLQGVEPHYLKYALKTPDFLKYVNSKSYGMKMPRLGTEAAKRAAIPLPPTQEQRRIVAKIDQLMALCDELETRQKAKRETREQLVASALDKLTSARDAAEFDDHWHRLRDHFDLLFDHPSTIPPLRQAILRLAVQGKLVPPDLNGESVDALLKRLEVERPEFMRRNGVIASPRLGFVSDRDERFVIPAHWRWERIGNLCPSIVPNRDKPKSFSGTVPWITLPDIDERHLCLAIRDRTRSLSADEIIRYKARIVPRGSVVMSCVGRFGLCAVVEEEIVPNQQIHILTIPNGINAKYVAYCIQTQRGYFEGKATSTTIAYLNRSNCDGMPLPLPPPAEQRRIVEKVESLLRVCDRLEFELSNVQECSETLLCASVAQLLDNNVCAS